MEVIDELKSDVLLPSLSFVSCFKEPPTVELVPLLFSLGDSSSKAVRMYLSCAGRMSTERKT